jgi:hypothetical protein
LLKIYFPLSIHAVTATGLVIRVMERHLQRPRKLAVFIAIAAMSLLLGACGGGGGGGGGASEQDQVVGTTNANTEETTAIDSNAPAQSEQDQVTGISNTNTQETTATDGNAPTQEVGFASLSWRAPSERIDGESLPLSEIAGYRIYYGISSGDYDSVLSIDDPYTSTLLIDDLPLGTYYFAMTTVDTNGLESGYSSEAVRIVQS